MDKNLDWLKNKVDSLETEVSEYVPHNDMIDRDEVLDLIDQLDEPEITEEMAWNKIAESYPADVRSLVTSFQNF